MFPKDSAFKQAEEAMRADPYSPHDPAVVAAQRQSYTPSPSISKDVLERWYASLNEEMDRLESGGMRLARIDTAVEAIRQVRDEIYSYLRG